MKKAVFIFLLIITVFLPTPLAAQSDSIDLTLVRVLQFRAMDVEWSFDGQYLAIMDDWDKKLTILDSENWEAIISLECNLNYLTGDVLSWHPNQAILATSCEDITQPIEITEVENQFQIVQHKRVDAQAIAWSPDGSQLAVIQEDNTIGILDSEFNLVYSLGEPYVSPPANVGCGECFPIPFIRLSWSPNGQYLAAISEAQTSGLDIWDLETYQMVGQVDGAYNIIWSEDSESFTVGTSDFVFFEKWWVSPLGFVWSVSLPNPHSPYEIADSVYMAYCQAENDLIFFDTRTMLKVPIQFDTQEIRFCSRDVYRMELALSSQFLLAIAQGDSISIWQVSD